MPIETKAAIFRAVTVLMIVCLGSAALLAQTAQRATSQPTPMPLWPNGAPAAKGSAPEDIPSIQLYQPAADKVTPIMMAQAAGYVATTIAVLAFFIGFFLPEPKGEVQD